MCVKPPQALIRVHERSTKSIFINVKEAIRGEQSVSAIAAVYQQCRFSVNKRIKTPIVQPTNESENPRSLHFLHESRT